MKHAVPFKLLVRPLGVALVVLQYIQKGNLFSVFVAPYADTLAKLHDAAGFVRLAESAEWNLERGGKYYFTRNM